MGIDPLGFLSPAGVAPRGTIVHASEISHATLDFRAGPHEAAAGLAVVTFEPLPLTPRELASRNGSKFKLTEIRTC